MTAKIKLNAASGGGSISIQAPSSSSNNRVISLPDIADGTLVTSTSTLDATKLSGNLPAISGASLTGINSISMVDQWRITTNSTLGGSVATLNNNWERNDTTAYGNIGSAMSESSGLFTFPTTGIYYIQFNFICYTTSQQRYIGARIQTTTDGMSSAINAADSYSNTGITDSNGCFASAIATVTFDVTNTSTHKIRFAGMSLTSSVTTIVSDSDKNQTCVTFIRLGDT